MLQCSFHDVQNENHNNISHGYVILSLAMGPASAMMFFLQAFLATDVSLRIIKDFFSADKHIYIDSSLEIEGSRSQTTFLFVLKIISITNTYLC